jgi:integrase
MPTARKRAATTAGKAPTGSRKATGHPTPQATPSSVLQDARNAQHGPPSTRTIATVEHSDRGELETGDAAAMLRDAMRGAVRRYHDGSGRPATHKAHASDLRIFRAWCDAVGLSSLPAESGTVAAFANDQADRAGKAHATIRRYLASITVAHEEAGHDSPCHTLAVRRVLKSIGDDVAAVRAPAVAGRRGGAAPLLRDDVRAMVATVAGASVKARRDRAVILVGYVGGFRASELAGLDVADVVDDPRGLVVQLHRTKTTSAADGREVSIPFGRDPSTCPVRALRAYLDAAAITAGPVFRGVSRWGQVARTAIGADTVSDVVKAAAVAAGLDVERVSAHSLRAGHVTQRRIAGDDVGAIQDSTGHRSERMVRHYDRAARRFRHDVAGSLGV